MGVLEQGAGAPLHFHEEVDEVIVVVEGTLDVRIGDERLLVGKNQTISIPARTPHAFTVVSLKGRASSPFFPSRERTWRRSTSRAGPPAGANLK